MTRGMLVCAGVNGFNLGRYWETEGPQHTLYIPGPRLNNVSKNGVRPYNVLLVIGKLRRTDKSHFERTELVVLELHNASASNNFTLQGACRIFKKSAECEGIRFR